MELSKRQSRSILFLKAETFVRNCGRVDTETAHFRFLFSEHSACTAKVYLSVPRPFRISGSLSTPSVFRSTAFPPVKFYSVF